MYAVDQLDTPIRLSGVPRPDCGTPCPIVISDEGRLALSYWEIDDPPYEPTTAPLAIIKFQHPYLHIFGPPNDEAISGHPLSGRKLFPCGAFRVEHSSLVRHLEMMNSVHRYHDPRRFEILVHYIFTFHDSTFECVAQSFESTVEHVGLEEEHARTLQCFKAHEKK